MKKIAKTAAALSALALVVTPVMANAASGAQSLSLANAPAVRVGAKMKKGNKVGTAAAAAGLLFLGLGGAAALGAFDSDSN